MTAFGTEGWALSSSDPVGGFFPCPLVPQYVQVSWSFDDGAPADGFFCLLYELPATASVACGSSRWDADLFPASFGFDELRACSKCHVLVFVPQQVHLYFGVFQAPAEHIPEYGLSVVHIGATACTLLYILADTRLSL